MGGAVQRLSGLVAPYGGAVKLRAGVSGVGGFNAGGSGCGHGGQQKHGGGFGGGGLVGHGIYSFQSVPGLAARLGVVVVSVRRQ